MPLPVQTVTRLAPAKINLALHVTGRRPDGYHLIESLAVFTRFGDRLASRLPTTTAFPSSGRFAAYVPLDAGNLVLRARDALRAAFPRPTLPAGFHHAGKKPAGRLGRRRRLQRRGRGACAGWPSSGASATLATLSRIGLSLGADVPMCLAAKPLVARGVGDDI